MSTIEQITARAAEQIAAASTLDALDALRVGLLGKSGEITLQLKQLGTLAPEFIGHKGTSIERTERKVAHDTRHHH